MNIQMKTDEEVPLWNIPAKSYFRIEGQRFFLDHIDGMYSYCLDTAGNVVHISAGAGVVPCKQES